MNNKSLKIFLKKEDFILEPANFMKNIKEGTWISFGFGFIKYKIIRGINDNNANNPIEYSKPIAIESS